MQWTVYLARPNTRRTAARFTSSSWEALWYLLRCRWWGTFCCNAWTVPRPGRWETSQSSRRRHSCSRDSRGSIWDHPSGTRRRHWAEGASPSGTQTEGGRSHRSLPSSPKAEIWVRSHFPDGRTSETAEFHHSCSSPVKQLKLHNMLCNKSDIGIWACNQLNKQKKKIKNEQSFTDSDIEVSISYFFIKAISKQTAESFPDVQTF